MREPETKSDISVLSEIAVSNPPPPPQNTVASTLLLGRWHSETLRQMGHKKRI